MTTTADSPDAFGPGTATAPLPAARAEGATKVYGSGATRSASCSRRTTWCPRSRPSRTSPSPTRWPAPSPTRIGSTRWSRPPGSVTASPIARRSARAAMRSAVREMGQTIVMVTHDPGAASYADAVLFLNDGRIVDHMEGPTPERVLDRLKQFGD